MDIISQKDDWGIRFVAQNSFEGVENRENEIAYKKFKLTSGIFNKRSATQ